MRSITIHGKTVSVFPGKSPEAPVIYLNTVSGEGPQIFEQLHKTGIPHVSLITISDLDWNHDLVPWDTPPVFKNAAPCTGGADEYLRLLTDVIVASAESELPGTPCWRGLAGYSLAGLFAVYALYGTDAFSRIASISGSLWLPGIKEYVVSHKTRRLPDRLYFSLGDKESKTRNPLLKTVGENTQAIYSYYRSQDVHTVFELNPGNHYNQAARRTAKGIAWLLKQ